MCRKEESAFTLVEFLAVLAIVMILASVSFAGAVRHQRSLERMGMDQTAKEIFLAAQHRLALGTAEGTFERLLSMDEISREKLGILLDEEEGVYGVLYPASEEHQKTEEIRERLLPFGAIEEAVRRDGSYLIVYEPDSGIIREVWYSNRYLFVEEDYSSRELACAAVDAKKREHFIGKNRTLPERGYAVGYYVAERVSHSEERIPDLYETEAEWSEEERRREAVSAGDWISSGREAEVQ